MLNLNSNLKVVNFGRNRSKMNDFDHFHSKITIFVVNNTIDCLYNAFGACRINFLSIEILYFGTECLRPNLTL